jgi:hypothetical protein
VQHKKSSSKTALNKGELNLHFFILTANTQNLTVKITLTPSFLMCLHSINEEEKKRLFLKQTIYYDEDSNNSMGTRDYEQFGFFAKCK